MSDKEEVAAKIAAAAREPQPIREGDTLGRAGRLKENGKPVQPARARTPNRADLRRVVIDTSIGEPTPVTTTEASDGSLARNDHQTLMHLDGRGEARPPKQFEDMQSELRAEIGRREREAATAERQARRELQPIEVRLAVVQQRLLRAAVPRAKQTRLTDARSADAGAAVPMGEGHGAVAFEDERVVDGRLHQIELHVVALEELLDAHDGLSLRSLAVMGKDEKDALICGPKFRGRSPEELSVLHPELGSAKTVRYVRSCAGQDGRGNPRQAKDVAA